MASSSSYLTEALSGGPCTFFPLIPPPSLGAQWFICAFARMNPPTPGHLKLIQELLLQAFNRGTNEIYIFLGNQHQSRYNPLDNTTKEKLLSAMVKVLKDNLKIGNPGIENIKVNYMYHNDYPNIISLFFSTIKNNPNPAINIFIVAGGEDRIDSVENNHDFFFNKDTNIPKNIHQQVKSVTGLVLGRDEKRDESNLTGSVDVSRVSGTGVRNMAYGNKNQDFIDLYKDYLTPEEIEFLYERLRLVSIASTDPNKKNSILSELSSKRDTNTFIIPFIASDPNPLVAFPSLKGPPSSSFPGGKRRKLTKKYTRKHNKKHTRKHNKKLTRKFTKKHNKKLRTK